MKAIRLNLQKKSIVKMGLLTTIATLISVGYFLKNPLLNVFTKYQLSMTEFYGIVIALLIIILPIISSIMTFKREPIRKTRLLSRQIRRGRLIIARKRKRARL